MSIRPDKSFRKLFLVMMAAGLFFAHARPAPAQKPGAHYWGDSDGNGIIEVPDLITLNTVLGDFSADDSLLYAGHPQSRFRQDLDGNAVIEVPDLIILNSWVPGNFSSNPGAPDRLLLDGSTHVNLNLGDSITLSAYALSPVSAGSQVRTGFGVIFKIDPSSTCTTAQIRGYDVAGGATINAWRNPAAYHYTLQPAAPDNGRASVRVNTNGCAYSQVVKIEVYIPDDTEAGVVPGRFPTQLGTTQKFSITVPDVTPPDTFITAYPPNPINSIYATFEFNCSEAICTYECQIDIGGWESCESPKSYAGVEGWVPTSLTNAPSARRYYRAVWTGTEMIIWGGYNGSSLNTGGRYNPTTDSWTATSTTSAPTARYAFAAVWTGTEMIVWGGYSTINTGGRYNPATDSWAATTTTGAPSGRYSFPAVWTGTEMIIFGGYGSSLKGDGFKYNPTNNSWTQLSTTNAPSARSSLASVWTGSKMIVWGGWSTGNNPLNTGGVYDPVANTWTATSTGTNVPAARWDLNSVWTGTEMIVWGGYVTSRFNTGGRYNPSTDSWVATTTTGTPSARSWAYCSKGAVWTGTEMIIWGGDNGSPYDMDGGRYNPLTDTWTATTTSGAPWGRYGADIVWTGTKMIVWSGYKTGFYVDNGGQYDPYYGSLTEGDHTFEVRAYDLAMNVDPTPASYTWTIDLTAPNTSIDSFPANPSNSPDPSFSFSCNETNCTFECKMDSEAWDSCTSQKDYTGLSYSSHTFQVRAIDEAGNPDYTPAIYTWTINAIDTFIDSHPPDPTSSSNAQFTFSCNGPGCTYECNLDSAGWEPCTSPASYSSLLEMTHTFEVRATDWEENTDPTPASFTWTIDQTPPETNIVSNPPDPSTNNYADFSFNCTEPPCTFECNFDSGGWVSCTSPRHYAELTNSSHNFQVRAADALGNVDLSPASYTWTVNANPPDTYIDSNPPNPANVADASFGFSCSEASCTYECKLDAGGWQSCASPKNYAGAERWREISTADAPSARSVLSAVWTGSEMIVWGGYNGSVLNTGGRYNPVTDSWIATTTTNSPAARQYFSAVWTGNEMIVWGGSNGSSRLNTGGRYNPSTDSWIATMTTNAPAVRNLHTAVWTGTEMIVWGGSDGSSMNTGGRYSPSSNSWTATTTTNAPDLPRYYHSAVWTGTEMIIWGGGPNTGGRYNPSNDSWTATSTTNAPKTRIKHAAVWTGSMMIIWGGWPSDANNNGGRYNPSTDTWQAITTTGAPSGRYWDTGNKAVWTGTEMIVWGGRNIPLANDGGKYNPLTDSWTATTTANAPVGRTGLDVVWTGTKMIVWGGNDGSSYLNTGGQYSPGYGTLNEGGHNFQVRAYDSAMNVDLTPASYNWTIDLTAPNTSIDSSPANPSNSSDASFYFSSNESNCTFECKMDSGAWAACASPKDYFGLSDSSHTFQVRAKDVAGNPDPTPAGYTWVIDTISPETYIDTHPPELTAFSSATFTFHCSETGCIFECNLDSIGWEPCASPISYSSLLAMTHTFEVRATDPAGNTDQTPASFQWTIDQTPPETTIDTHPPDPDSHNYADFSFICNESPCTFQCNLDSGGWQSCISPVHYVALTDSSHTFMVRATDQVGNQDQSPATYIWTVAANPADTFITTSPPDPSSHNYASFEFGCSSGPCIFECNLDAQGWMACASPKNYVGLSDALHNFQVRAIDAQNNTDPTPASYSWTISATPPDTFITAHPDNPIHVDQATFEFDCIGGPCTFECNLDSLGWEACASPKDYTSLADASHTFQVRAIDSDDNVDPTPASYAWTVRVHDYWIPTALNTPVERMCHTAVWTGSEMIIWGGLASGYTNSGGRYDPVSDSWIATSTTNAPYARWCHTAVWTGTMMVVWGGYGNSFFYDGGRYDPSTDSWTSISLFNAPSGRQDHTAIWTGSEMIIWGGWGGGNGSVGYRYNPVTDEWTVAYPFDTPTTRHFHTAVWTGTEMIIWGGFEDDFGQTTNTGSRYSPVSDSWTETSTTDAPSARQSHVAVWTGTKMVVWGGCTDSNCQVMDGAGGIYDPALDAWAPMSSANAPSARARHTAAWTGNEMIVWGGAYYDSAYHYLNSGGLYFPSTDTWTPMSTDNAPIGRDYHTSVWTGTEMIVWGGEFLQLQSTYTGGKYNPITDSWADTRSVWAKPSARMLHSAVWTGSEMIIWGGVTGSGSTRLNDGAKYDPYADNWTATSTTNAPSARNSQNTVWTGAEMIIWGGGYNTGGRYDPVTDSWTSTSTVNAPQARYSTSTVWTGTEMIIWGGDYGSMPPTFINTGGRYNPVSDSWIATSTGANCPSPRESTAVWTGTEMIVWGGYYSVGADYHQFDDGGRYDPNTDSWIATSMVNVPHAREGHAMIWTGTEMIIWGGGYWDGYSNLLNTGGRYNPTSDTWISTSVGANVPLERYGPSGVWTGSRMLVWGGFWHDSYGNNDTYLDTGGSYDPSADSWLQTATLDAPSGRYDHSAIWTGSQMIIWGGGYYRGDYTWGYFDTGGRYVP